MPGTDLREGVHTLPVLYALRDDGPDADRLRELLAGPVENDADVAEALAAVAFVTRHRAGQGDRRRVRRAGPR